MLLIKFQLNWIIVFRGDVQIMKSQHFSHINTDAWESKFNIALKRSNLNVGSSFLEILVDLPSPMICAKLGF